MDFYFYFFFYVFLQHLCLYYAIPSPWYSHELRSEAVYDGTERQAVPEGR